MKRLFLAANLPEASLVRDLLEQAGVPALVFNEHAPGAAGELPLTEAYPEVWVAEDADLPRARAIVANYERSRHAAGSSVRCGQCGEDNPPGFEICWHCAAPLPSPNPRASEG